ncbi:MAG: RNase adapter RapZ [Lachnospiraceae bacterium]|jgi:UPF0042 nucleotide-binding protein|nr:RNase adapter RapZ [Lachnospiraceae bacterium]
MRVVVITGMSGGGKSTALKMLEDMGFYCVDNLPVSMIVQLIESGCTPGNEITKLALGLDVRTGQSFQEVTSILDILKKDGYPIEILFMNAEEEVLIKRYKETRRVHPLAMDGRVEDGLKLEKKLLETIRTNADYVIDTSTLLTRELREELERIFLRGEEYNSLMITIVSFGFKYGLPIDADLIFDVRFLPNPFYVDELKHKTGLDQSVQDYVMSFPEAGQFMSKLEDMIEFLIPCYRKEGKYQLIIAIGCTGGKHRSVTLADELYSRLETNRNFGIKITHRDMNHHG